MTAARTIFTPREVRYRGTIADDPDDPGQLRGFIKFLEAHSISTHIDWSLTSEPATRER